MHMLNTLRVNAFLKTAYTVEQIAAWPPVAFVVLSQLQQSMNPPKKGEKKRGR